MGREVLSGAWSTPRPRYWSWALLLLLAALAGKLAHRAGLPAVLAALALSAGLIAKEVSAGLIGAVVVSIAASSVLVRLVHRPSLHALESNKPAPD